MNYQARGGVTVESPGPSGDMHRVAALSHPVAALPPIYSAADMEAVRKLWGRNSEPVSC
jgi:hypothetical protein